jgi:hypothetical protein
MIRYVEKFLERKAQVFLEIRNILQAVDKLVHKEETADKGEYISRLRILSDQFNDEYQAAWYRLMAKEVTLHEQLEVLTWFFVKFRHRFIWFIY